MLLLFALCSWMWEGKTQTWLVLDRFDDWDSELGFWCNSDCSKRFLIICGLRCGRCSQGLRYFYVVQPRLTVTDFASIVVTRFMYVFLSVTFIAPVLIENPDLVPVTV